MKISGIKQRSPETYEKTSAARSLELVAYSIAIAGGANPDPQLYTLPSNSASVPLVGIVANVGWAFYLPGTGGGTLLTARIKGNAAQLGTVNTIVSGVTPIDIPVDLYVNGTFVQTLGSVPAGGTDFDVQTTTSVVVPSGGIMQFVADVSTSTGGLLENIVVVAGCA